jgi:hypothetical protein
MAKKIVRLTENDISRLVRKVLKEQGETYGTSDDVIKGSRDFPDCTTLMSVPDPTSVGMKPRVQLPTGCKLFRFSDGGPAELTYYIVCDGKHFCQITNKNF